MGCTFGPGHNGTGVNGTQPTSTSVPHVKVNVTRLESTSTTAPSVSDVDNDAKTRPSCDSTNSGAGAASVAHETTANVTEQREDETAIVSEDETTLPLASAASDAADRNIAEPGLAGPSSVAPETGHPGDTVPAPAVSTSTVSGSPSLGSSLLNRANGTSLGMFRHAMADYIEPGEVCMELAPTFNVGRKPDLLKAIVRVPGVVSATIESSILVVVTRTANIARNESFHGDLIAAAGGPNTIVGVCKQSVSVAQPKPLNEPAAADCEAKYLDEDEDDITLHNETKVGMPRTSSQNFSFFSPTNFMMGRRLQDYGEDPGIGLRLGAVKFDRAVTPQK